MVFVLNGRIRVRVVGTYEKRNQNKGVFRCCEQYRWIVMGADNKQETRINEKKKNAPGITPRRFRDHP